MTYIKSFSNYFGYFLDKVVFTMAYLFFFVILLQLFLTPDTEPITIPRNLYTWISGISICLAVVLTVKDKLVKTKEMTK
ncbi:hypothetical protein ACE4WU_04030 [Enterococcus faecalis]|uniref:hypothetical protein n=1 Tax=Enterococcus faecalis TaxID=1351 RepID=UPI001A0C5E8C|nr:hypothetical protein [Enterococcus faecalis]EGO9277177.1 hypothetical protein [Enterococcus faecalis]